MRPIRKDVRMFSMWQPHFIECSKRFWMLLFPVREMEHCVRFEPQKANGIKTCGSNIISWDCNVWSQRRSRSSFTDKDWTDPNYKGINAYIRAKTLAEKAA